MTQSSNAATAAEASSNGTSDLKLNYRGRRIISALYGKDARFTSMFYFRAISDPVGIHIDSPSGSRMSQREGYPTMSLS
ncbi:hypothetical protein AYI69_g2039 [Smittium culicis]|uniref:Uncharacterized protein n=1 Tax=Smittium culicis TaxID=133412 RepID=A0A1R1YP17_9FUNG|nr:hypothetical protein AYI69_g2039 [Smittium culicis]